ncbi:hypothetical protein AB0436_30240 [Streptomyces sp. NPDC051322]|uniref:hypothetical protein n=1 Tax=Streptomyces sp. NPDC051322 TaxID=3154645 RepID=UPI0034505D53
MTAKKTTPARRRTRKCTTCKGTGEVAVSVRVGRTRRAIDATQTGLCLSCLGTGDVTND